MSSIQPIGTASTDKIEQPVYVNYQQTPIEPRVDTQRSKVLILNESAQRRYYNAQSRLLEVQRTTIVNNRGRNTQRTTAINRNTEAINARNQMRLCRIITGSACTIFGLIAIIATGGGVGFFYFGGFD